MTNMTIIDPDIVYFRLSASGGAFCIAYNRFNYYFTLDGIYSMAKCHGCTLATNSYKH